MRWLHTHCTAQFVTHRRSGGDDDADGVAWQCTDVPTTDHCMVYLLAPVHASPRSYIGATHEHQGYGLRSGQGPWRRCAQHNGHLPGGVERLRSARPWRIVAWVDGFPSWKHALKFEHAWQQGLRGSRMKHVAQFRPSAGATGKLQVLAPLMFHTQPWVWHQLSVHVVANHGADRHMLAREARWKNTLEQARVAFEVASDECAWYAWQVMHTQT